MDAITPTQRGYLEAFDRLLAAQTVSDRHDAGVAMGVMLKLVREDARRGLVPPSQRRRGSSARGRRGAHVRWHSNRGVVSPDCGLCAAFTAAVHP